MPDWGLVVEMKRAGGTGKVYLAPDEAELFQALLETRELDPCATCPMREQPECEECSLPQAVGTQWPRMKAAFKVAMQEVGLDLHLP